MINPPRPATDAGFLEAAARIIFMGGLNRQVVDGKWTGFRAAFANFDVETVAEMGDSDVNSLATDDRVIKYRAKLAAVIKNAKLMKRLASEHGSFAAHVDSLVTDRGVDQACEHLAKGFSYISKEGARNWLYATGFDVGAVTDKVRAKYFPFQGQVSG